ncbi:hypothetical protein [Deinococcus multiflagellatus]|uniref:Uncharacterized protein n=1 Tax=Deinococcus multiflagellatus TaxID=1656887 RepID=A0ABW1ZTE8_9DEIO|nr:hypothetical protein [Deinococcus multiflagellatus]MBZ9714492.1 hypothetical protein [Deinococcus multiflagellatus]
MNAADHAGPATAERLPAAATATRPPLPVVVLIGGEEHSGRLGPDGHVALEQGRALFERHSTVTPAQRRSLQALNALLDWAPEERTGELRLVDQVPAAINRALLDGVLLDWTTGVEAAAWVLCDLPGAQMYQDEAVLVVTVALATAWPALHARRADLELATLGSALLDADHPVLADLSPATRRQVDRALAALGRWVRVQDLRQWLAQPQDRVL